jgi:hypothetical protein
MTGRKPIQAVRDLLSIRDKRIWNVLGSFLFYILMSIGVGIAISMAMMLVGLLLVILFGIGSLFGFLLMKFLSVSKLILILFGVLFAIPCFIAILALMSVPAETFMNYIGIELLNAKESESL